MIPQTFTDLSLTGSELADERGQHAVAVDLDHHKQRSTTGDYMLVGVITHQRRRNHRVAVH